MTIYNVMHEYDTDGGFGDAVWQCDLLASFESEEDAKDFVSKYANPHVYDKPYADLSCGELVVEEVTIISHSEYPDWEPDKKRFWWLN